MVVVDTSVLRDTIVDISGRVDRLDEVCKELEEASMDDGEVEELRREVKSQGLVLEDLRSRLAKSEKQLKDKQKQDKEDSSLLKQLLQRISDLEKKESDDVDALLGKVEEQKNAHEELVLELKPLKDKQHELSVELHGVKTTQKTALIEQTDMKSKQVLLQQRMAQVELLTGNLALDAAVAETEDDGSTAAGIQHMKKLTSKGTAGAEAPAAAEGEEAAAAEGEEDKEARALAAIETANKIKRHISWNKAKTVLVSAVKSKAATEAAVKEQKDELEELQKQLAAKPDDALQGMIEGQTANLEGLYKTLATTEVLLKGARDDEERAAMEQGMEEIVQGPSFAEQLRTLRKELMVLCGEEEGLETELGKLRQEVEGMHNIMVEMDQRMQDSQSSVMRRPPNQAKKKNQKQSKSGGSANEGPGSPAAAPPPVVHMAGVKQPVVAMADSAAMKEMEGRVDAIAEDLEYETTMLQDSLDTKMDEERVMEELAKLYGKQKDFDKDMKDINERLEICARNSEGAVYDADGNQITLKELDGMIQDLKVDSQSRDDALSVEQQLRGTIKIMADEMTLVKKHLVHLGHSIGGENDVGRITANLQSKIQAMNEAFGNRCKGMEEHIEHIGAAGNTGTLQPKGQCISCSRPTTVKDQAPNFRADSPPRPDPRQAANASPNMPRPASRPGKQAQRYYNKPAMYSSSLEENGWNSPMDRTQNLSVGSSASAMDARGRPKSHHGERHLAPLGRPVNHGQPNDDNPMNLSGISTASPMMDSPFKKAGSLPPQADRVVRPNSVM